MTTMTKGSKNKAQASMPESAAIDALAGAGAQTSANPQAGVDDAPACCARYKDTPRSDELQKNLQQRLNRVIGQLNGVKTMLDENRYCGDVLIQLSAAESALKVVERIVLQNHLETCMVEKIQAGDTAVIEEAMDLVKRVAR